FDFSPNVVEDENAVRRAQRRSRRPGREATIPPSPLIVHCCHCSWCQRQNGSAFAVNALVEADRVHLLQGDVVDVEVPSPSGANQRISRCPKCQVAVWSYYLVFYGGIGERVRFIRVGTLDDPGRLPPDVHIYTSSKQPWLVLPEDALAVEEYYVSKEVWPKESLERLAALLNSVQG
ncbi:MAG: GFA family protein, partial [Woeseiaceae bacterium]